MIPFKVEVDYAKSQLESFRKELRSDKGFNWEAWDQAAQWCLQHNTNLDQALLWSDTSISFSGRNIFLPMSDKALILDKLGRGAEAAELMKKALPFANTNEVHLYARQLLSQKKTKEAFDVFKMNYDKHPNKFTTNVGMARAYSAMGNYKKALEFAQKAQPQAPDPANKANLEKLIKTLQDGKDING
jgi:tetratricopeptide (TPR) repeat protein